MTQSPSSPPFYSIYGEPVRELDPNFVFAENISERRSVHNYHVKPHRHDRFHQIGLWRQGGGVNFFDDRSAAFRAPTLTIMPAGVVHGFKVDEGSDGLIISASDGFLREAIGSADALLGVVGEAALFNLASEDMDTHRFGQHFAAIEQEQGGRAPDRQDAIAAHLKLILIGAARLQASAGQASLSPEAQLLSRFRALLERYFNEDWTVARYVEALGTTPYLLNAAVRAAFGHGVQAAVHARRLTEAKRLLLYSNQGIGEIAFDAGFTDAAYFSRFFRAHVGATPQDWRRQKQAQMAG